MGTERDEETHWVGGACGIAAAQARRKQRIRVAAVATFSVVLFGPHRGAAQLPDADLAAVCGRPTPPGADDPSLRVVAVGTDIAAGFRIAADGTATVSPEGADDIVRVLATTGMILRVDMVDLNDPTPTSSVQRVHCAHLGSGETAYRLQNMPDDGRHILRFRFYGRVTSGTPEYDRSEVWREAAIDRRSNEAWQRRVRDRVRAHVFAGVRMREAVLAWLAILPANRPPQAIDCRTPADQLAIAICDGQRWVHRMRFNHGPAALPAAEDIYDPAHAAHVPGADRCEAADPQTVDGSICAALHALEVELEEAKEMRTADAKARAFLTALPQSATADDSLCSDAATLRWLEENSASAARLIGLAEIPLGVELDAVRTEPFAPGYRAETVTVPHDGRVAILLERVPAGGAYRFEQRLGERLTNPWLTFLDTYLPLALRAVAGIAAGPASLFPEPLLCGDADDNAAIRVDPVIQSVSLTGTRAYVTDELPRSYTATLRLCPEAGCGTNDNTNVAIPLAPPRGARPVALVDLGVNLFGRVVGDSAANSYYRTPTYVAVGGSFGPEQLYQLRNDLDVRRLLVISALFGVRVPNGRHAFVLGPSLVDGSGKRSFRHWSFRYAWRTVESVDFTVGIVISRFTVARDGTLPHFVTVERATQGVIPNAPQIASRPATAVGLTIGIAFDIVAVGNLWKHAGGS